MTQGGELVCCHPEPCGWSRVFVPSEVVTGINARGGVRSPVVEIQETLGTLKQLVPDLNLAQVQKCSFPGGETPGFNLDLVYNYL